MSEQIKNTIELNIYDDDLEIVKTLKSYGIKWKTFKIILSKQSKFESLKDSDAAGAIDEIHEIVRLIFPKITEEDLNEAYMDDLYSCFMQAINVANKMAKNF